jgi:glycosyltransferase involved in cell wall biosynthesis
MSGDRPTTNAAVWVVTDQLPYPPRNGITLPLFHYLCALAHDGPVRLCLFLPEGETVDPNELSENEARFGKIVLVRIRRHSTARRVLDELVGRQMYQHGWGLAEPFDWEDAPQCSALFVSPLSAVAKCHACGLLDTIKTPVRIAATHDCATAEYRFRPLQKTTDLMHSAKAWLDRWRTRWISAIENRLLTPYDAVLLQTKKDKELLAELVSVSLSRKVTLLPNGVSEHYFELPLAKGPYVIFVAELSGEYDPIAKWLIKEVWPKVRAAHRSHQLLVVGRGASTSLIDLMQATEGVVHRAFVQDLASVYQESSVAVSPVFKGFGLINKTVEAMACGLPVVGGLAAFNGIRGFQPNVHGLVCQNPKADEFIVAIQSLLDQPGLRAEIGIAARRLLAGQFRWDNNAKTVLALVHHTQSVSREVAHAQT